MAATIECDSEKAALNAIRSHEIESNHRYATYRSTKNFGNSSLRSAKRVYWEDKKSVTVGRQDFIGIPFVILGTKGFDCQFGKDRKKMAKERRKAARTAMTDHESSMKDKTFVTKKIDCGAGCILREIVRFPDYQVEADASASKKRKYSIDLKSKIKSGDFLYFEKVFVTCIPDPSEHTCYSSKEFPNPNERLDDRLSQKIKELCEAGVTELNQVRNLLHFFVREICNPLPHPSNSRFYPSATIISNHIYRYTRKKRNSAADQQNLENWVDDGIPLVATVGKKKRKRQTVKDSTPLTAQVNDRTPLATVGKNKRAKQMAEKSFVVSRGSPLTTYILRLGPGEEIMTRLQEFVTAHYLKAAFIITCVGSVSSATLRMADSVTVTSYLGNLEIVSLVGTLSAGGHIHGSFSDGAGQVVGGHVIGDLKVYTTAEIVIGNSGNYQLTRELDERTGYKELVVDS